MGYGSQRDFPYTDDDGVVHAIRADESNVEMCNTGADSLTVPAGTRRLPPDIQKRYIKLQAGDGSTKRVPILTRDLFIAITSGQSFAAPAVGEENAPATSFVVVFRKPETYIREAFSLDSGKVDGDNP